jgi:hypothetical protein
MARTPSHLLLICRHVDMDTNGGHTICWQPGPKEPRNAKSLAASERGAGALDQLVQNRAWCAETGIVSPCVFVCELCIPCKLSECGGRGHP